MKKLYAIIISLLFVGSLFGIASIFGAQYTSFGTNTYKVYDAQYNWIEIKDTGTEITEWLGLECWDYDGPDSDDGYIELEPGFSFSFYGQSYNKFYLSTNGHIDFTQGCGNVLNNYGDGLKIPQPSEGDGNDWPENPFIGFFFCDLDPSEGGNVYYQDFGNYMVIEYLEIPMYYEEESLPSAGSHTFEVILYQNGNIKMQYNDLTYTMDEWGHDAVVGLDLDATTGVSYDGPIRNGLALWFTTGADPDPKTLPITQILKILKGNQEN